MVNTPWTGTNDGTRLTVNAMVKSPALVRARIISMLDQQFLTDALLRKGPNAPGGAVEYSESTPPFLDSDAEDIAEFGELPLLTGSIGGLKVARTREKGFALGISKKMMRRDDVGSVDNQLTQGRNTMLKTWENYFIGQLLANASVNTMSASALWSTNTTRIRDDLAEAMYTVENSDADTTNGTGQQKFQFQPDTLVVSTRTAADMLKSDDVAKVFIGGDIAAENPQYKGYIGTTFFGLKVVKSWRLPVTQAIVLQSKVVGFISDEQPLEVDDWRDNRRQMWMWGVTRDSAIGIDQPRAACIINGVHS